MAGLRRESGHTKEHTPTDVRLRCGNLASGAAALAGIPEEDDEPITEEQLAAEPEDPDGQKRY